MLAKTKILLSVIFLTIGITTLLYSNDYKILNNGLGDAKNGSRDTLNPEIVIWPNSFYVVIKPDTVLKYQMTISNEGNESLDFSILKTLQSDKLTPALDRSVEGSTLSTDFQTYLPGESVDYTFNLYNGSPDNEWLDTLIMHFPDGVSLNFSTNFAGGSLGPLVFDGNTGNAVTASWNDENGSGGNIVPGETAVALLNLGFDEALDDTLRIPYEIYGDVFGSGPHYVFDTLLLAPENVWLITEPKSGLILPGEELTVDLYINSGGFPIGYYNQVFYVESNDSSNLLYDIPVTMIVFYSSLLQTLSIPEGWSGISTYVLPNHPEFEEIFDEVSDRIQIIKSNSGMYWPDQQINSIGDWNSFEGYIVNASEAVEVEIPGLFEVSQSIYLEEGWNIMPVLTTQVTSTFVVFRDTEESIDMVMEIGGNKVYWPSQKIYTLTYLEPGKAYYIRVTDNCSIHFPSPVE